MQGNAVSFSSGVFPFLQKAVPACTGPLSGIPPVFDFLLQRTQ
jgi:hypothetical protein